MVLLLGCELAHGTRLLNVFSFSTMCYGYQHVFFSISLRSSHIPIAFNILSTALE